MGDVISYKRKSGRATAFTSFLRPYCLAHLHRSPVRKTGSFLTASPCGGFNSRAFIQKHMGSGCPESRRGSIPQGVLFDSKPHKVQNSHAFSFCRQEGEEAREVKYRAPCTNWAHKFADGKTMADDKTQLGRHIWRHTVISGANAPGGAARLRALLSSNWFHCYW